MQSESNEFRAQATERLFLVNQAVSDVLEKGKAAKEAERCCSARISMPWTDYSLALRKLMESPLRKGIRSSSSRRPVHARPNRTVLQGPNSRLLAS
jgi:hypothetical protein